MSANRGFESISIGQEDPNVIAIKVKGKMTEEDMAWFVSRLEEINDAGNKAKVYFDLIDYEGFEMGMVKEKLANMRALWTGISKLAYVIDMDWMMKIVGLIDAITPMHFRAFSDGQQKEAQQWILE